MYIYYHITKKEYDELVLAILTYTATTRVIIYVYYDQLPATLVNPSSSHYSTAKELFRYLTHTHGPKLSIRPSYHQQTPTMTYIEPPPTPRTRILARAELARWLERIGTDPTNYLEDQAKIT